MLVVDHNSRSYVGLNLVAVRIGLLEPLPVKQFTGTIGFLQCVAKLASQALYMLWHMRTSVCSSVHHTLVLCQNEGT